MKLRRSEHQAVSGILQALDGVQLRNRKACFGGGTRIVLALGEFRVSKDLDFICGNWDGFAALRIQCRSEGPRSLFLGRSISFPREARTERDVIRFLAEEGEATFKCEILYDPRFEPEPGHEPDWGQIPLLKREDCVIAKLLANDDRLHDRATAYRDLVDLAAMRQGWYPEGFPENAIETANHAYRGSVTKSMEKALTRFSEQGDLRRRCFQDLHVDQPGLILEGLKRLGDDFGPRLQDMSWREEEALEQYELEEDEGPEPSL